MKRNAIFSESRSLMKAAGVIFFGVFFFLTPVHGQPVPENASGGGTDIQEPSDTVSLVEKPDRYLLRLHLPTRNLENVDVSLNGQKLYIVAPSEGQLGPYQQELTLESASSRAPLQIDRRENEKLLLVTISKASADEKQAFSPDVDENEPRGAMSFERMDHDILGQMDRMQREMERFMGSTFPDISSLPNIGMNPGLQTGFSSTDLREEKDRYVVRATLPDAGLGKINISVKNRLLTIEGGEENSSQGKDPGMYLSQQYSQAVELPGPVQIGKMKVDHQGNTLVVTLPKASGENAVPQGKAE